MSIEVSIVMNSYNKYPQCLYSLYALEYQTFPHKKMEVILVDDTSSDETPLLANYNPPFIFKYIRPAVNQGRSRAKNIGIAEATGHIIIMLDAEVIVEPDFVRQQYLYHQSEELVAVTTCFNHRSTYTVYDPQFNSNQLKHFQNLLNKKIRKLPQKSKLLLQKSKLRRVNGKLEIFSKEDIGKGRYKDLSFPTPYYPHLIQKFQENFHEFLLPWMFVITHKLSFKRSLLDDIGNFYEGFDGYGSEDWEFGYRLYKYGVKIIDDPHGCIYHQEHPRNSANDEREGLSNYIIFFKRHRGFDIGALSLCWIGKDELYVNEVVKEYVKLCHEHPGEYAAFIEVYKRLFELVLDQLYAQNNVMKLLDISGLESSVIMIALAEKGRLQNLGVYNHLTQTMDFLLSL
ncbi:glycosyltransferase family 2 protein [Ectobacillus antri]|uniref:Glycosyltransferase family 2 protein n=1 Tax=Ectobacillus antri TaxID=2486280 RepID=A0ABT6H6K2_9BACI|nr:glycosyltransferase family 2 protein [Ectobacillus antri]MDG4656626.1 glycosyltransferase family 2 protein [Ectobacillus antri]MDG5754011.1 glycosyltransferase family 2 protein [Ectobacillus antri]